MIPPIEQAMEPAALTKAGNPSLPPSPMVEAPSEYVRTPAVGGVGMCPQCHEIPLRGPQTVCSAACRRAKARQREAAIRRAREREVRAGLGLIITLAQDALVRLDQVGAPPSGSRAGTSRA
jgi:hypothetical protein